MTRSLNSGSTVQNFSGVIVIRGGGGSFYLSCMCHCEQGRGQAYTFPTIPERVLKVAWGLGLSRGRFIWLACSGKHGGSLYTGGSF